MQYTIENEFIRLTVDSLGAEMVSAIDLATGSEMIWCADPAVWNRHAPILFPYAGKLTGGHFKAEDGKIYAGGQHGFARDMEHALLNQTARELTFELRSSDETRAVWPYDFALRTTFSLEGRRVRHAVSVRNTGKETLRFGLGFHPGFTLPFDDKHTDADYDILFDTVESPLCLNTAPNGLIGAAPDYYLARNVTRIPLSAELFARDSHCMVNLKSKSICVLERDTGRRIRVDIENFPYTLIWSTPQKPMRFICVEPWHSIPGEDHGPIEWAQKPCAASLEPDEVWQTALDMAFER
ncbi:MAG: aldose 1-epimerase family protein [Christensenellales bacterium]|nr:aldose 1-epimerase family protein [Christensenellales bacterium]